MSDDEAKSIFHILTISRLLSHTSGLSQHAVPGYNKDKVLASLETSTAH